MLSSTGLPIHPISCGWLTTDAGTMITGQTGDFRMPVPAFLVEHPKGLVLFDSGMHPDVAHSTDRLHGLESMFTPELAPDGSVGPQLRAAGFDPADVAFIVSSHLHFDHCGGHVEVPNARLLVQSPEWQAGHNARLIEFGVYDPADFDIGHDVELLDGEHDIFGDGTLRTVVTPGHTSGHQSLVVEGRTILVGDACYCRLALDLDALPSYSYDAERQRETFTWLREQEAGGAQLVFSHDLAQWESLSGTTP